jgi:apolipoprotein N-acyltransferase
VLVQQNSDPRKSDYAESFAALRRLTEEALSHETGSPDLVVWSETAFVPNIRRWSGVAPEDHPYAALTRELLVWQKSLGAWLLTGNDDYELGPAGEADRRDYNAAILFAPDGTRVETYRKLHLVPFTESFPWKRELPGVYRLLERYDVYLWEPGDRRVVFRHPALAFATPICFEDSFPDDVRRFVSDGAEAILNLTNDYWSLTEVEAIPHAANAVFRAVENDCPMVRASASGLTCSVDRLGRIVARAPLYEEAFLSVTVPIAPSRPTLYARWGDWFPIALCALLAVALAEGHLRRRRRVARP